MKPSDLQAGKTYVGKNGRRRKITSMKGPTRCPHAVWYERPNGGCGECLAVVFARWAEREASDEEVTR